MARQLSAWNKFVKSVFQNERKKNPKCTFAEALKKASQLKKSGKMKGGDLETGNGMSSSTSTSSPGLSDGEGEGEVTSSPSLEGESGITSSSTMMGGKTRKRRAKKAKKTKKSRKSRKSRKSKK